LVFSNLIVSALFVVLPVWRGSDCSTDTTSIGDEDEDEELRRIATNTTRRQRTAIEDGADRVDVGKMCLM
jgi:hypothetical protein